MLTKDQLARIAQRNRLGLGVVERDYLQHLFLALLFTKTQELIFKGGTALRVAYNFARYSEDLDFNSFLSSVQIKDLLTKTVQELSGFGIRAELRHLKVFKENGERGFSGDISYEGPLFTGKSGSKGKVRVDISLRGEEGKTQKGVINSIYDDLPQFILTALTLEEIFAEKVRALIVRTKPRDLYDVWVILESGVKVDYRLINKKLTLYQKEFDFSELKRKIEGSKKEWEQDLRGLLPQSLPFEQIKKAVIEKFK